jgi:hypothetical protein
MMEEKIVEILLNANENGYLFHYERIAEEICKLISEGDRATDFEHNDY